MAYRKVFPYIWTMNWQEKAVLITGGTGSFGRKFAEIVAATVLCGELSLWSAIVAEERVAAHDLYGRNRP